MKRGALRVLKALAATLLGTLAAADVACELFGVPRAGIELAQAALRQRGVLLDVKSLRCGLVWGLYARHVTIWDANLAGVRLVEAEHAHARLDLWRLLHGQVALSSFALRNGVLQVPSPRHPHLAPPLLVVTGLTVDGQYADGGLDLHRVEGEADGVRVRVSGLVSERPPLTVARGPWRRPRPPAPLAPGPPEWRGVPPPWQLTLAPLVRELGPRQEAYVAALRRFLAQRGFSGSAGLEIRLSLFARQPWRNAVSGTFSFPEWTYRALDVRECAGRFMFGDGQVRIRDAHLDVARVGTLDASALYDLRSGLLSGDLRGRVNPVEALRAARLCPPSRLADIETPEAATFTATLEPSPPDPARWRARFTGDVAHGRYRDLPLERVHAQGRWCDGTLRLEPFEVVAGPADSGEWLSGALAIAPGRRRLSGSLRGVWAPYRRLQQVGVRLDRYVEGLEDPGPLVSVDLTLADSPCDPEQWCGCGTFQIPSFRFRGLALQQVSGRLDLSPERLGLALTEAGGGTVAGEHVEGEVQVDRAARRISGRLGGAIHPATLAAATEAFPPLFRQILDQLTFGGGVPTFVWRLEPSPYSVREWTGEAEVEATDVRVRQLRVPQARARVRFAPNALELLPELALGGTAAAPERVAGRLHLDIAARQIGGELSGQAYPDRLYAALGLPAVDPFRQIHLDGAPAVFAVTLQDSPWSPETWRGRLHATVDRGHYGTLLVTEFDGDIDFGPKELVLHARRVLLGGTALAVCELRLNLPKVTDIDITGQLGGDPALAAVFVPPGEPRNVFNRIWEDVRWAAASPPAIQVDRLHIWLDPNPRSPDWSVKLEGTLTVAGATWRGTALDAFKAKVTLDLPAELRIDDIATRQGESHLEGKVRMRFGKASLCDFEFSGMWDPWSLLRTVDPTWAAPLEPYPMGPRTWVSGQGTVPLSGDPLNGRLAGAIEAPTFTLGRAVLEEVGVHWGLHERRVVVDGLKGRFAGGAVVASGSWDPATQRARGTVEVRDMDVAACLNQLSPGASRKDLGLLVGRASLEEAYFGTDGYLRLRGRGDAEIAKGDLWRIPFLRGLGEILTTSLVARATLLDHLVRFSGLNALGQITRIQAELEFAGDRLVIPALSTDGTILALRGHGEYTWDTGGIDFFMRGVPFEKTLLVPLMLTPLTWLFVEGARCTGTAENLQWRSVSPLERVFPGREGHAGPDANDQPGGKAP